jgi:hypothetical protein
MEHRIKFVGYSAYILNKKRYLHGTLDFITGDAHVVVRGELFEVPNGEPFRFEAPQPALCAARFRQFEPVLQKVEILGSQIKRRPWSEYLDEFRETGIARVEIHGEALFQNRTLIDFHPVKLSAFVVPLSNSSFNVYFERPKSQPPRLADAMKSPAAASGIATIAEFAVQMRWSA